MTDKEIECLLPGDRVIVCDRLSHDSISGARGLSQITDEMRRFCGQSITVKRLERGVTSRRLFIIADELDSAAHDAHYWYAHLLAEVEEPQNLTVFSDEEFAKFLCI